MAGEEVGKENKVQFGIKGIHFFQATDNGSALTYGESNALPGATELELDPEGDMIKFYADNLVYYSAPNNQGYTGKMSVANVTEKFEELAFGTEKDDKGLITENVDSKGSQLAVAFEFDGDAKATRHVLFNVTFSRPKISSETKTEKAEPKALELEFTAMPDPYTGNVKTKTSGSTSTEVYDAWYTNVAGEKPATPPTEGGETKKATNKK